MPHWGGGGGEEGSEGWGVGKLDEEDLVQVLGFWWQVLLIHILSSGGDVSEWEGLGGRERFNPQKFQDSGGAESKTWEKFNGS